MIWTMSWALHFKGLGGDGVILVTQPRQPAIGAQVEPAIDHAIVAQMDAGDLF